MLTCVNILELFRKVRYRRHRLFFFDEGKGFRRRKKLEPLFNVVRWVRRVRPSRVAVKPK